MTPALGRALPPAHFPSLDGIRACSFLLVFAAHAGLEDHVPGGFGVTVFFFLSGYLITTMLRLERAAQGHIRVGQFYLRRALRILPPFYLVLGLSALAAVLGFVPGGVSPRALGAQLLHGANYWIVAHGYSGQPAGTGVYWSLAVEEHFYAVFPFLYLLVVRVAKDRRAQAGLLFGLVLAVLVWRCVLVLGFGVAEDRTYVASDTRVDSILFGCALALWGNPVLDTASRFSERSWKWILLPLGVLLLLFTFIHRGPVFRETLRYTLQGVGLVPVFVVALRYPTWGPMRLLNLRVMSYLGVLSYPLYLVHHVVLYGLEPITVGARVPLALALTIVLAWGIHELVEKPALLLRKRFSRRAVAAPRSAASPVLAEAPAP